MWSLLLLEVDHALQRKCIACIYLNLPSYINTIIITFIHRQSTACFWYSLVYFMPSHWMALHTSTYKRPTCLDVHTHFFPSRWRQEVDSVWAHSRLATYSTAACKLTKRWAVFERIKSQWGHNNAVQIHPQHSRQIELSGCKRRRQLANYSCN